MKIKLTSVFVDDPNKAFEFYTEWGTETVLEDTCGNLIQLHQG